MSPHSRSTERPSLLDEHRHDRFHLFLQTLNQEVSLKHVILPDLKENESQDWNFTVAGFLTSSANTHCPGVVVNQMLLNGGAYGVKICNRQIHY